MSLALLLLEVFLGFELAGLKLRGICGFNEQRRLC
jgi:hypothetical protein